eukprot:4737365-Pleurochrysis_carterae.AAC.1
MVPHRRLPAGHGRVQSRPTTARARARARAPRAAATSAVRHRARAAMRSGDGARDARGAPGCSAAQSKSGSCSAASRATTAPRHYARGTPPAATAPPRAAAQAYARGATRTRSHSPAPAPPTALPLSHLSTHHPSSHLPTLPIPSFATASSSPIKDSVWPITAVLSPAAVPSDSHAGRPTLRSSHRWAVPPFQAPKRARTNTDDLWVSAVRSRARAARAWQARLSNALQNADAARRYATAAAVAACTRTLAPRGERCERHVSTAARARLREQAAYARTDR